MIAIIDYGAGNILSVQKAFAHLGEETCVTADAQKLMQADAAVLPGVGAFGDAMINLRARGLEEPIKEYIQSKHLFLGICLGLQILFEQSEESPAVKGLGMLKGKAYKIPSSGGLKIPHIGWNSLDISKECTLYKEKNQNPYLYFVHSYYVKAEEPIVTATAEYEVTMDVSVQKGNLMACQYHPEKSGDAGLRLLKNFVSKI